jgi:anti-sigma factor RsiW
MSNAHLNDVELVLSVDGELSPSHAARVRAHLSTCEACCIRRDEFASALSGATVKVHVELDDVLPSAAVSRARLRASIAELATDSRSRPWWQVQLPGVLQAAAALCGVLLLGAATLKWIVPSPVVTAESAVVVAYDPAAEPNISLTPGAVRNVSLAEVCAMPHEEVELDVPAQLRSAVFKEYGISSAHPADYEIDYLIAPGLGGTEDIHNLWPEPYTSAAWNAHVKDSLEEYLHESVCAGKLDLRTAQSDISHDWIAAYKKYFHTDKPLPEASTRTTVSHFEPDRRARLSETLAAL